MSDRWGCPDWRDARAYPAKAEDLKDWQWRWEALRRWPGYRANFEVYSEESAERAGIIQNAFWMRRLPDASKSYQDLTDTPFLDTPSQIKFGTSEALENLWPSASGNLKMVLMILDNLGITADTNSPYRVAFSFDLTKHIDPQIKKASRQLKELQDQFRELLDGFKKRSEHWPRHLRVIDAKDQGATHAEIFLQFADEGLIEETADSQPNAVVSQWHKQAVEVMKKASRFL